MRARALRVTGSGTFFGVGLWAIKGHDSFFEERFSPKIVFRCLKHGLLIQVWLFFPPQKKGGYFANGGYGLYVALASI